MFILSHREAFGHRAHDCKAIAHHRSANSTPGRRLKTASFVTTGALSDGMHPKVV